MSGQSGQLVGKATVVRKVARIRTAEGEIVVPLSRLRGEESGYDDLLPETALALRVPPEPEPAKKTTKKKKTK